MFKNIVQLIRGKTSKCVTKPSGLEAGKSSPPSRFLFLRFATPVFSPLYSASISQSHLWTLQMTYPRKGWTLAQPSNYKMQQQSPRLTTCGRINPILSQQVNVAMAANISLWDTWLGAAWPAVPTESGHTSAIPFLVICTGEKRMWSCSSAVFFLLSSFYTLNLTNKVIVRPVEQGNYFKEQFRTQNQKSFGCWKWIF